MARSSNLKSTPTGDAIKVSWDDILPMSETNHAGAVALVIVGIVLFFVLGWMTLLEGNGLFLAVGFGLAMGAVWFIQHPQPVPRSVKFTPSIITIGDREFPTAQITRFEYGDKKQLTGAGEAGKESPTIIRFWLDDKVAHTVGENRWQTQVSHQIHSALTEALEAVRNADKQQEHEEKFGVVGDDGMPDY